MTDAPGRDDEAPRLAALLEHRDAPCPICGYNLRGLRGEACTECGSALRVGVVSDDDRAGPWLAAIVACAMAIGFDLVTLLLMMIPVVVSVFTGGGPPLQWLVMPGVMLTLGGLSVAALLAVLRRRRLAHGPGVRAQWWAAAGIAAAIFLGHLVGGLLIVLPML